MKDFGIYEDNEKIFNLTKLEDLLKYSSFNNFLEINHLMFDDGLTVILPELSDECRLSEGEVDFKFASYFNNCPNIEKLDMTYVPTILDCSGCKNLKTIILPAYSKRNDFQLDIIFNDLPNVENIYIDENNKDFTSKNGILYGKDKTDLIYFPGKNESQISEDVTIIRPFAFYEWEKDALRIPYGVKILKDYALTRKPQSKVIKIFLPDTLEVISDSFAWDSDSVIYCSEKIKKMLTEDIQKRVQILTLDNLLEAGYRIVEVNNMMKDLNEER